jgi:hypothetical protein
MEFSELENETFTVLSERLETSDTNWAFVGASQSNVGVQIGAASLQGMAQVNAARITVLQANF